MPRELEIPSYESLLTFQEVMLQAISLAWKDDSNPDNFRDRLINDADKALENAFGYVNPWNVKIRVEPASSESGWKPKKGEWDLPKMKIRVGVPTKPEIKPGHDLDSVSYALACYNNAGPAYLFSCC